jgi:hypothetical protein
MEVVDYPGWYRGFRAPGSRQAKENQENETMRLSIRLSIAAAVALLASCSFKMGADGSKEVIVDANAANAAVKIIAEK